MKKYVVGSSVPAGLYLSVAPIDLALMEDDGALNGPSGATYLRVPLLLAIVTAPLVGGIYAVTFPLLVLSAMAAAVGRSVVAVRTYAAGESGPWGLYVGINRLAVRYVSASGEDLPGRIGTRYLKVPAWTAVLASPFIGGAYVVLFPFIVAAALAVVLVELGYAVVTRNWEEHAHLAHARFTPAASYLLHPSDEPKAKDESGAELDELSDLEAEARDRQTAERDEANRRG